MQVFRLWFCSRLRDSFAHGSTCCECLLMVLLRLQGFLLGIDSSRHLAAHGFAQASEIKFSIARGTPLMGQGLFERCARHAVVGARFCSGLGDFLPASPQAGIMRGVGAQTCVANGRHMAGQNVKYERRGGSASCRKWAPDGTPKRQL